MKLYEWDSQKTIGRKISVGVFFVGLIVVFKGMLNRL